MARYTFTVRKDAGEHVGFKRSFKANDTFQSDVPLHKLFVNKFDLVPDAPVVVDKEDRFEVATPRTVTTEAPPTPKVNKADSFDFDSAVEVSNAFPGAEDLGYSIYKGADGYAVAEADAPVKYNLAGEVFTTKKSVRAFIEACAKAMGE